MIASAFNSRVAKSIARLAGQVIAATRTIDEGALKRNLHVLDILDARHGRDQNDRDGEQIAYRLRVMGLDPDNSKFWTFDDTDTERGAYMRAVDDAAAIIGRDSVQRLIRGITTADHDSERRWRARLRLRSAIRANAADEIQGVRALRASQAGHAAPIIERIARQSEAAELANLYAIYEGKR